MIRAHAVPLLSVLALLAPVALHAEDSANREAALFDRPALVKSVPPKSGKDQSGEIRCTWYRDFMVRETGTDSPAPGAAAIVPRSEAGARASCTAAPAAGEVPLKTEDHSLLGKKGPFLVFDAADPYGAVPFIVIDSGSGRVIYTDGKSTDGLKSVALAGGSLHISYKRAFNGSCPILKDAAGCWSKIAQAGNFPPRLAKSPPPVDACTASYAKGNVPADDPSMITYDVDVTIDAAGKSKINSFGTAGCDPLP